MRLGRAAVSLLLFASLVGAAPEALSTADRREIIGRAADLIERRYVDERQGRALARKMRSATAPWLDTRDPKAFARAVTAWLRRESGDGHLGLSYSPEALSREPSANDFQADMERWYGPGINHGIEKIERLKGNIMLLDLRAFPPPEMGADVIAAAMNLVAQGDALIIDLRNNGGGAETASLVLGYLLAGGSQLSSKFDRPSGKTTRYSSPEWVPGRRFGSTKPLFVLVSKRTFSAAEAVAYDLQALKRATIVGERTGGGAHPFEFRPVHPHFALDLPEAKSVNPITGGNWQGTGVLPDVAVPAEQALEKAVELAAQALAKDRSAGVSNRSSADLLRLR